MKKLDLRPYMVRIGFKEDGSPIVVPYNVKQSIEAIMLASGEHQTAQKLNMSELLRRAEVARKIADCPEDFILLEENEWKMVKQGFDAFKGFSINEVELCKRIENAETVEVTEKK
jgi:hypothetical protein